MGGGQAGAPADDDHVSWTRPPRRGHCDSGRSWRGPAREAGPAQSAGPERADGSLTPGSGPRGQWEGSGSERLVGGRGGAEKSATQSQRQLAIDKANV